MDKPVRTRQKYIERTVSLRTEADRALGHKILDGAPLDEHFPLQLKLCEEVKKRTPDQGKLMWAGPLKDISEQVWCEGRRFSDKVWHEQFKKWFLPDPDAPDFDATHVKDPETYTKWEVRPDGELDVVGSTTELSTIGMSVYLEQIYAFGASEHGVHFSANPKERMAA